MKRYVIHDGSVEAVIIPEKGATAVSLKKDGVEFMYIDEANLESPERPRCGIPILFPIYGRLQDETYHWEGKPYHLGIHGFAHTSAWTVESSSEDALLLSLSADENTLAVYPFLFHVTAAFRIADGALQMCLTYENRDVKPMPYQYGFHPYFRTARLENITTEVNADARMDFATGKAVPFGHGQITLSVQEGAYEAAASLTGLKNPVILRNTTEGRSLTMTFSEDFPQLVLWHWAGRPFLCAEPINGSHNGFNMDHYLILQPGESKTVTLTIRPDNL